MTDLQERLAALRRQYAATLPEAVAGARAAYARVPAEGSAAIEEVWQTVHRIYGTAGSYRIDGVAEAARRVEEALTAHREAAALPDPVAALVEEALAELAAQADLAART